MDWKSIGRAMLFGFLLLLAALYLICLSIVLVWSLYAKMARWLRRRRRGTSTEHRAWETTSLVSATPGSDVRPHEGVTTTMLVAAVTLSGEDLPEPAPPAPVPSHQVESYLVFRRELDKYAEDRGVIFTGEEATALYWAYERSLQTVFPGKAGECEAEQ